MKALNEQELTQILGGKGKVNWKAVKCQASVALGAASGGLGGNPFTIAMGMAIGYGAACR